jgi:hypothetical protein
MSDTYNLVLEFDDLQMNDEFRVAAEPSAGPIAAFRA